MAVTTFNASGHGAAWGTAAAVLARATIGMLALGLFGFGRKAALDRATGRVARG